MGRIVTAFLSGLFIFAVSLAAGWALSWSLVSLLRGGDTLQAIAGGMVLLCALVAGGIAMAATLRNDRPSPPDDAVLP